MLKFDLEQTNKLSVKIFSEKKSPIFTTHKPYTNSYISGKATEPNKDILTNK